MLREIDHQREFRRLLDRHAETDADERFIELPLTVLKELEAGESHGDD